MRQREQELQKMREDEDAYARQRRQTVPRLPRPARRQTRQNSVAAGSPLHSFCSTTDCCWNEKRPHFTRKVLIFSLTNNSPPGPDCPGHPEREFQTELTVTENAKGRCGLRRCPRTPDGGQMTNDRYFFRCHLETWKDRGPQSHTGAPLSHTSHRRHRRDEGYLVLFSFPIHFLKTSSKNNFIPAKKVEKIAEQKSAEAQ